MGFKEWQQARMAQRQPRQQWSLRSVKELLHLFQTAESKGIHIEILGYVECDECYASTPLDDVLDATGFHPERMVHGLNAYDLPCSQDKRESIRRYE